MRNLLPASSVFFFLFFISLNMAIGTDTAVSNSIPTIIISDVAPDNSSATGWQVYPAPFVMLNVAGAVTDLNGYDDINQSGSYCLFNNSDATLMFTNCANITCDFSCNASMNDSFPSQYYTISIYLFDSLSNASSNLSFYYGLNEPEPYYPSDDDEDNNDNADNNMNQSGESNESIDNSSSVDTGQQPPANVTQNQTDQTPVTDQTNLINQTNQSNTQTNQTSNQTAQDQSMKENATKIISEADKAIKNAKNQGIDVSAAYIAFSLAQQAYDLGNYTQAIEFAKNAITLTTEVEIKEPFQQNQQSFEQIITTSIWPFVFLLLLLFLVIYLLRSQRKIK